MFEYVAQLENEGWSDAEAWAHFCWVIWKRAAASKSKTVVMGDRYRPFCMKLIVPDPPAGMVSWTMLGAEVVPGLYDTPSV